VDPTLRNKKISFTQFRAYLDQYYANITGETITGNVTIAGNLTVTGTSNFTSITGTSLATFSGVVVQNNLTTSGTVSGAVITGNTAQFTNLTAVSGTFTDRISGATVTGDTFQGGAISGVSGVFTSYLSGATVTGNTGLFTDVTGSILHITTPSGATPAIVCSGVVSGSTAGFVIQGPLVILP